MQCIIANVAQIMTWRFAGKIQLKNASQPAVACGIMPTQPQARCKLPLRKQKELNLEKQILLLREMLSYGTKDLIEMHDCYRQTWVQLFWIQNLKIAIFFCFNMLKIWIPAIFEAKWSQGIQLYSSHSVVCPTSPSLKGKHSCRYNCAHPNTFFFF